IAAEAMARSRAGIGLMIIALLGGFFIGVSDRNTGVANATPRKLLLIAVALALVLTLQFALYRILQRFDETEDEGALSRTSLTANTIQAVRAYMPVGSGIGSFPPVYHLFEAPKDVAPNVYVDNAVNDVAQAWLETGVFGLALMGWFAFLFVRRSLAIWRSGLSPQADLIDRFLSRSATIVIPLLAAHAFLDHLFHTSAIMAVAAFACAIMIEPPTSVLQAEARASVRASSNRALRITPAPALVASPTMLPLPKSQAQFPAPSGPKQRWGTDVEWPDEWRSNEPKARGQWGDPE
ncbi:MAG: O-antigen ligase family protein, partial [Terriglobales bacterium]